MATNTTNYGFKKPDESDFYDVNDQNNNWDAADDALKELDTPTFEDYTGDTEVPEAATALENIKSKGKLATLLSNIKAFCKGCVTQAMLVNNTATNNSQLPVSSAVTHDLQEQLNVLNTNAMKNFGVSGQISNLKHDSTTGIYRGIVGKYPWGTVIFFSQGDVGVFIGADTSGTSHRGEFILGIVDADDNITLY